MNPYGAIWRHYPYGTYGGLGMSPYGSYGMSPYGSYG